LDGDDNDLLQAGKLPFDPAADAKPWAPVAHLEASEPNEAPAPKASGGSRPANRTTHEIGAPMLEEQAPSSFAAKFGEHPPVARPQITIRKDLSAMVDEGLAVLRSDPSLYQRGGILAHV